MNHKIFKKKNKRLFSTVTTQIKRKKLKLLMMLMNLKMKKLKKTMMKSFRAERRVVIKKKAK